MNANTIKSINIDSVAGVNLYTYCYNNPIMFADVLGYNACNSVIMMALFPHSLPNLAPPGSVLRQRTSQNGKLYRKRYYGDDWRPVKDREYTNHGNEDLTNPHDNPFGETKNGGWGHNGEHLPVDPNDDDLNEGVDYDPNTGWQFIVGTGLVILGTAALIYTVANDVTIIGAADDVSIPGWISMIGKGVEMIFG